MERFFENEIFKDAIKIECKHVECKGYTDSSGQLRSVREKWDESWYAHYVVERENVEVDGDYSDSTSGTIWRWYSACEFYARNLARTGTNFERATRTLGMTTRQTSTENLVMSVEERCWSRAWIGAKARDMTSLSCWGCHRGDRWSRNKEGCVRLLNKRRLTEHIQKVFMRLSQCEILTRCKTTIKSTSLTHTFCRRPVCLNKHGAWLKLDVGEFVEQRKVIEVETLRHQLRKKNAALYRTNAVWLHNPNQGVITTVQEDENYTRMEVTRRNTGLIRWFQDLLESIERTKQIPNQVNTTSLVHVLWFELVPTKRDVRDSVVQIRTHESKSERLIQSETVSNAGETENHSMDQLEAIHQREYKDTRQWQERIAQISEQRPIIASVLQWYSNCKIGVLQGHGFHTLLQDEVWRRLWWIWQLVCKSSVKPKDRCVYTDKLWCKTLREPWCIHRHDTNTETRGKCIQKSRYVFTVNSDADSETTETSKNRKRQLSKMIVNIETNAQTEWNQWKVEKFEAVLTMIGSWQQWAKQRQCKSKEQSKSNKQYKTSRRLTDRTIWRTNDRARSRTQWRARMTEIE